MEHVTLEIDHAPFEVHALEGHEALSQLFRLDLTASIGASGPRPPAEAPRARDLLGRTALVELSSGAGHTRRIQGVVTQARASWDRGGTALRIRVEPRAAFATARRNCRVFQDTNGPEMAARILGEHGCPPRTSLTATYEKREYCAQYREDDWTFLSRWLEEEGIHLWFDHAEEGSAPRLSDWSPSSPDIDGDPSLPFAPESGARADREVVHELARESQSTPSRFSVVSFDPRRPALRLAASEGEGRLEDYRAPGGGPESPEACRREAHRMSERAACRRAVVIGSTTSVRVSPGRAFTVTGHPELSDRYFVVSARYRVVQRSTGGGADLEPYTCRFTAIRSEVPYRPEVSTPRGAQPGLQTGAVVGAKGREAHYDVQGQARVQHHWDREGARDHAAGKWMRVAQRGTTGSMLLPRVGFNVLTFNEEGAIDAPSVLGRLHDGEHPPSYTLPDHKTKVVLKTATLPSDGTTNELHFEDAKGREELFLHASRDMVVHVQHDDSLTVKRDASRKVGRDRAIAVTASLTQGVARDHTVTVAGDHASHATVDQARSIGGSEHVTIGGDASLKTGAGHSSTCEGERELRVGAALIDVSLGNIAASAGGDLTFVAGGGRVHATGKNISEEVAGYAAETVGGAKLEIIGETRTIGARDHYVETAGISLSAIAGEQLIDLAESTYDLSARELTIDAPKVSVTAQEKIEIVSGAASIVLEPESATISGASLDLTQSEVLLTVCKHLTHN